MKQILFHTTTINTKLFEIKYQNIIKAATKEKVIIL